MVAGSNGGQEGFIGGVDFEAMTELVTVTGLSFLSDVGVASEWISGADADFGMGLLLVNLREMYPKGFEQKLSIGSVTEDESELAAVSEILGETSVLVAEGK